MENKNQGGQQEANRSEDMQKKPAQGTDANRETQGSGNKGNQGSNQSNQGSNQSGSNQGREGDQQDQKRPA